MTCIFCDIIKGAKSADMIAETEHALAFVSLDGHPLIVPRKHVEDVADLDAKSGGAIMTLAAQITPALRTATGCTGLNLVMSNDRSAGQDVAHLHLHLKPRSDGDGVVLDWDTTVKPADERAALARSIKEAM